MKISIAILSTLLSLNAFSIVHLEQVTREEIVEYAKTGLGTPYQLGGSYWKENQAVGAVDCGGLVQKAWRWPVYTRTEEKMKWAYRVGKDIDSDSVDFAENITYVFGKLHTSNMNKNPVELRLYTSKGYDKSATPVTFPWTIKADYPNFDNVKKGDAFDKYISGKKYGHLFLVDEKLADDLLLTVEAVKPSVGQLKRSYSKTKAKAYKHLVRNNLKTTQGSEISPPLTDITESIVENSIETSPVINGKPVTEDEEQELEIVSKVNYTVKSGDSLYKIAQASQVTLNHILRLNPSIKNKNMIVVGQVIRVK
jgi:LysM repeat protein